MFDRNESRINQDDTSALQIRYQSLRLELFVTLLKHSSDIL